MGGYDGVFHRRCRDPDSVVEEVAFLRRRPGLADFFVFDEIFTMAGHTEQVCRGLVDAGLGPLAFTCEGRASLVTRELLRLMHEAGCRAIFYGLESSDPRILAATRKDQDVEQVRRAVRLPREAGLLCGLYVMLGFPDERAGSFLRTTRLLLELSPDMIRYDFVLPYPSTVLRRQMEREGLILGGRAAMDRRTTRAGGARVGIRSRWLSPTTLVAMDRVFKELFAEELCTAPLP